MNAAIILILASGTAGLLAWGFRALPRREWQFLATVPRAKCTKTLWAGTNLTYYGLFSASAVVNAVVIFAVLLGAIGVAPEAILALSAGILGGSVPAAKLVARLVERKKHTLTVAGAAFVGLLLTPLIVTGLDRALGWTIHCVPVLAALGTAYAFGEAIGRLACISFGCCYGKPLSEVAPWLRRGLARWAFVFHGSTRKVAYAGGLEGVPVVPIQGISSGVCAVAGVVGVWLFAHGWYAASFAVTVSLTQGWRIASEVLRADYRGGGRVSAYQVMGLGAILYVPLVLTLSRQVAALREPDLLGGLAGLWNPTAIVALESLWLVLFVYTGCSRVTGAIVSFRVHRDRI